MAVVAAAAAIVGAGITIYGDISSANDQASLDQSRASVATQQAAEIQAREVQNEAITNQQAYRQKLQFGASYAASGKQGVGIGSQLQIQNQADLQNLVTNRESQFQESMLQQQAGIDTTLASETQTAGTISALGAGVGGVSRAAGVGTSGGSNPGYGGTQGIGAYPQNIGQGPIAPGALGGG